MSHKHTPSWPKTKRKDSPKENLIMIQAFPANKRNSRGTIEFLAQYFNVHFIELPGFGKENPPIKIREVEDYVPFLKMKIAELNLDSYILSGLSFGFLLASLLPQSPKCSKIIALEPYCGYRYLKINSWKRLLTRLLVNSIIFFKLEELVWNWKYFSQIVNKSFGKEIKDFTHTMIFEGDAKTFFKVASLLLVYDKPINFKHDKYTLVLNMANVVIDAPKVVELFGTHLSGNELTIVHTDISHSAKEFAYYKKTITEHEVNTMMLGVGSMPQI